METYTNETLKDRINHAQEIDLANSPIHKFILDNVVQHILQAIRLSINAKFL